MKMSDRFNMGFLALGSGRCPILGCESREPSAESRQALQRMLLGVTPLMELKRS